MFFRRLIVMLLIVGLFTLVCGCASHRPRVMKDGGAVSTGGSTHIKGGLARSSVSVHSSGGHDDCWDIFLMVLLFTWLFSD